MAKSGDRGEVPLITLTVLLKMVIRQVWACASQAPKSIGLTLQESRSDKMGGTLNDRQLISTASTLYMDHNFYIGMKPPEAIAGKKSDRSEKPIRKNITGLIDCL